MSAAEDIVRRLAADMPTEWGASGLVHSCACCQRFLAMDGDPATHEPSCVYIAAYLWEKEHAHDYL